MAIAEWTDYDIDPNNIMATSNIKVEWRCEKCSGIYTEPLSMHIRNFHNNIHNCPYCNNRKPLSGFNTLDTVIFNIDKIWGISNIQHYSKLLPTSNYKAEWKCTSCEGYYSEYVNIFVRKYLIDQNNCPYCTNRKVLPDYNSFQVRFPELMREWNYKCNYLIINPNRILSSYSDEVWWTCICGKNYKMSPKKRIYYLKRHMTACPYCKGRRRKKYRHF